MGINLSKMAPGDRPIWESRSTTTIKSFPSPKDDGRQTTTPDVTFRNSYYPEDTLTSLQGKKTWQDQGNAFGLRPEDITLQVTRTYQNGIPDAQGQVPGMVETMRSLAGLDSGAPAGVIELQSDDPGEPNYLQWNKSADANTWVYTISNLEQYAPDGKQWRYTVKEILPDESHVSSNPNNGFGTVSADNHDDGSPVSVPTIENYLKGKLSVVKKWDDGLDADWKQRPSLTVRVQAKIEGGEWGDAGEVLKTLRHHRRERERVCRLGGGRESSAFRDDLACHR